MRFARVDAEGKIATMALDQRKPVVQVPLANYQQRATVDILEIDLNGPLKAVLLRVVMIFQKSL